MKLYQTHADRRAEFEILAFHDASVKDFAELDEKLAPIIENTWKGKTLPFPILLDASGETLKSYGIHAYPTTVLIDPQGRVYGKGGEEMLEEVLAREK